MFVTLLILVTFLLLDLYLDPLYTNIWSKGDLHFFHKNNPLIINLDIIDYSLYPPYCLALALAVLKL